MRILGAAAVMLASVSAGFFAVTQKRRRLRCLRDLCDSLTLIAGELEGKRAPLPELIQTACLFSAGEPRGFFKHLREALPQLGVRFFFQLWEETARQHLPSLNGDEVREWTTLGRQLGRAELDRQLSALEGCCRFLSQRLEREERAFQSERKLCLGLPAAMGALLLILLF